MRNTLKPGKDATKRRVEYLCRSCANPLLSSVEQKIGIHVRCVHNANLASRKMKVPVPSYGTRKQSDW